jgi:SAM-dependent methyltransferase
VFRKELLSIVRARPSDTGGLVYAEGIEEAEVMIVGGKVRSPASGETYKIKNGYLDLGCSAGLHTCSLARTLGDSGEAVGIDISPSMLNEAARRAWEIGVTPSFVRADAHNLPFADSGFSGAVCGGTLNELGDPARARRAAADFVPPGL